MRVVEQVNLEKLLEDYSADPSSIEFRLRQLVNEVRAARKEPENEPKSEHRLRVQDVSPPAEEYREYQGSSRWSKPPNCS